jgi:nucleoside-diphosphate-sugar epimerase
MRVLVTGATGCLGGTVARKLAGMGHTVTGTGRDRAKGAALAAAAVRFQPIDLCDAPAMQAQIAEHDVVMHCGGLSSPWGRWTDFRRHNVRATQVVASAARDGGARLLFVSSPSVYFDYRDRLDITEQQAAAAIPVNAYAASKIAAEQLVQDEVARGLDGAILRPRAIFGETDTALLPRLLRAAAKGRLPLIDGGRAIVDLTYVENVADALIGAALRPERFSGQIYNISNGEPIAVRDLMERIKDGLGLKVRFVALPFRVAYAAAAALEAAASLRPSRPEPVLTRYSVGALGKSQTLSIAAARRDLGYAPAVPLQVAIDRTISAWRQAHA